MSDLLVWIDCEMTGLDLGRDALVEVACVVTDGELNQLDEGVDVVIKPPPEVAGADVGGGAGDAHRLRPAGRAGRRRHAGRGRVHGARLHQDAISRSPRRRRCAATPSPPTASFISRDMPAVDAYLHYRMIDVSSVKELARRWYPAGLLRLAREAGRASGAGRHHREHQGAALLPRGGLRGAAGARFRHRPRAGRELSPGPDRRRCETTPKNRYTFPCAACGGHGGCSSVGRAPGCGPGCRGFKSPHSPHEERPVLRDRPFPYRFSVNVFPIRLAPKN